MKIPPKRPKGDLSGHFDPLANTKQAAWQLNDGQNNFVTKYFSHWLGGSIIQDSILEDCPIPDHSLLKQAKLDPDMVDLLPSLARTPAKQVDAGFMKVQSKIGQAMAPLGKLWAQLENVAAKGSGKCKIEDLMGLVEKSVLLFGQSQVALEHNRRLYLLSRFMRDPKKAAELLKRNEPVLERAVGREELFSPTFYKALYKRAKGNKRWEIKWEFAAALYKAKE